MRYLIVFLMIVFLGCNEKVAEAGTLEITYNYCKYEPEYKFPISGTCKLFKNTEEVKSSEKNKLIFKDLPFDDYYIEYTTIYNERKRLDFKMNEMIKNIHFCVDNISYDNDQNILLIDELKTNQKLILKYDVAGCFHSINKELEITKTETTYIVSYLDKNYTLSEKQIQLFREFEIELYKNHSNECSTVDTYHIGIIKFGRVFTINDGSCAWRGFPRLIKLLNLQ